MKKYYTGIGIAICVGLTMGAGIGAGKLKNKLIWTK